MVTGSHIPFDRNGLKFYRPDGEITKADEAGIVAAPARRAAAPPAAAPVGPDDGVGERYVARYVDFFGPGASAGSGSASGSTAPPGATCRARRSARLGAEVVALGRTDGFVPDRHRGRRAGGRRAHRAAG